MQHFGTQNEKRRTRRAYIIYSLDCEAQIEMITNPGTDLEHRSIGSCQFQFEFDPTIYIFALDLPDIKYLREKNTVIFEITYFPRPLFGVSFYSDRYSFTIGDDLTSYFMIGLKFRRNERNLSFSQPPGEALNNSVQEFSYFYFFLLNTYVFNYQKALSTGIIGDTSGLTAAYMSHLNDLHLIFKNFSNNSGIVSNPKVTNDYFKLMDEFTLLCLKYKECPEIFAFQATMFGVFPFDFLTSREFSAKNSQQLLLQTSLLSPEILIKYESFPALKNFLCNGYYILVNMAIKEGYGSWLTIIKDKLVTYIFENEQVFYNRVNDFIKLSGTSMKSKDSFVEAKGFMLKHFYFKNPQALSEPKMLNAVIKNIAILSMSKESLLDTVFEFFETEVTIDEKTLKETNEIILSNVGGKRSLLDSDKLKILKEEIKRKKWDLEAEENLINYINKLNAIISCERSKSEMKIFNMKDEFVNMLYDISYSVKYLFALMKVNNFDVEKINCNLLKRAFSSIHEISLEDFGIVIKSLEMKMLPEKIQNELLDANFYERLKQTLKKVALPFDEKSKVPLRNVILSTELFSGKGGSLDYIRDFIKSRPTFDDLIFICRDLIYPQKSMNNQKKFIDIWLNVKNYVINLHTEIYDLIKSFSIIISSIVGMNEAELSDFKQMFCDEVWKSIQQRYSTEVFLTISQFFSDAEGNINIFQFNPVLVDSYIKNVQTLIAQITKDNFDKVNQFFSALSIMNMSIETPEKALYVNTAPTEIIVISLLDKLLTINDEMKKTSEMFLFENPSKDFFWYRLIKVYGKFQDKIRQHPYFINVTQIVIKEYEDIKANKSTIHKFILISKHNSVQREAFISYLCQIEMDTNQPLLNKAAISEIISTTLNDKLVLLEKNLNSISNLEMFYTQYQSFIEHSEDVIQYIKEMKESYTYTQFANFTIRRDLNEIISQIEVVNKWSGSVMFKNIFEIEYIKFIQSNFNKTSYIENIIKIAIENILSIFMVSAEQIHKTLSDILLKEDFCKLTLSVTKKYFNHLDNYLKESNLIDEMVHLPSSQKQTLISILKTFCEITSFIRFSNSMIQLDSLYFFSESNVSTYMEFLDLINNTDSTFDKIFNSSKRLSAIRASYLGKRDIENIIYELSEDKELTDFLVHTPEEDIRNMVDAVDEHGDSFIRVQTIRDLLIIGSFVKSLSLKDFQVNQRSANPHEEELIERIHNAFKKSSFTGIDVLLNSCMKQFLGIKHLHNELSNREEASKIKAKEIAKQSSFEYLFNKNTYDVVIRYGKSGKKILLRDLGDLRDRVLLLLYNEKESSNAVQGEESLRSILFSFIKAVELNEKILFILCDLYHNGHPARIFKTILMNEGQYQNFEEYLKEISEFNNKWNEDLKEAYMKYYPLTYYNGNQFWELEALFQMCRNGVSDIEAMPGFYLLKFADPNITAKDIVGMIEDFNTQYENTKDYSNSSIEIPPKERIIKLGDMLAALINPARNGSRMIGDLKKVHLSLKKSRVVYSSPENIKIYSYLLSLHFSIENLVPSSNQFYYCTRNTTFHEIIAFLYRMIYCPVPRLFTLIRVENLSFDLQNFLVEQVNKISKNKSLNSFLSIICCDMNSYLHTQFSENYSVYHVRDFDILDDILIAETLKIMNLNTFVVRSDDTGAGKTHFIRSKVEDDKMTYIDFPIVDNIDISKINERFYKMNANANAIEGKIKFVHLTISGIIDDYEIIDYILFSVIIIRSLKHDIYVSFHRTIDPIYIEIANTYNDYMYNAISILQLLSNQEMIIAQDNIENIKIVKDIKDPLQIIVNYLYNYDKDMLNDTDINPEVGLGLRVFNKDECLVLLQKYFIKNSPDITFRQINIFISVMHDQLIKFSNNYFFSVENLGYIQDNNLKDIRQRIMHCLLIMTEEFTTRSIKAARDSQNMTAFKLKRSFSREEINNEESRIDEYNSLSNILSWSSSNHLLIMFHDDGMCVTPVFREVAKVNEEVRELAESQRTNLEDYSVYSHFELLEKLLNIVGRQFVLELLSKKQDYILTADNFLKMLLIIIRARCSVPIVIMGETGCGKTSLVRFLATEIMQEGFEVINFHAGIKEGHIIERMTDIISRAEILKVTGNKIWVFLDEINTCDCLGLITEIICHKSMKGEPLPDNLVFIAACNPYKLRKKIKNEIGLVKQRVASRLVYRVHPLPDALIDYVWDYGSLTEKEEKLYIGNILSGISGDIKKVSIDLVCQCQIFIRQCEDRYSVSLRDVARFKILHEWFYNALLEKNEEKQAKQIPSNEMQVSSSQTQSMPIMTINKELKGVILTQSTGYSKQSIKYTGHLMISRKALVLSLMMCYYNRISKSNDRLEFKKQMSRLIGITENDMDEMINEEQRDLVTRMELPPAIAINKALLENVFTLLVCVINKIPLFICGKPGCSKSLSVQLLVSNLRGQDSHDNFFKKLPRILAIPYQGSESSTSEGIEKIFEKARNVLSNNKDSSILPLVVFDEIGLAEISKNNPLKILHSLLEPEKAELAFVGISNWRLDASKMNRAVYLARPDPDLEDLEKTALSIFEYYIKEPRYDEKLIMKALARTYYEFKRDQEALVNADFHGTRDFYSLLKQVTREFNANYHNYNEMKFIIIRDALCRNFGGHEASIKTILESFAKIMNLNEDFINGGGIFKSSNVMDLVKENLSDRDSRFLLLFTNGDSASYILDNFLKMDLKERVFMIGSEFEMDKDKDEHSFRLLSDIILYMESGSSVILKNLDQIYGSLYDLFNQNFMIVGQKKNCRIALGSTNNPMCFVNHNFHCVVLVDIKDLHRMDPPFLNRFEKQVLTFDSVLTIKQKQLVKELNKWIKSLTTISGKDSSVSLAKSGECFKINTSDLIITYNPEFSHSLVLEHDHDQASTEEILESCKKDVLKISSVSLIVYSVLSEMYLNSRDEVLKAHRIFFEEQQHDSLNQFMESFLEKKKYEESKLIVYTYSNILDEIQLPCLESSSLSSSSAKPDQGMIVDEGIVSVTNSTSSFLNVGEIKSEKEFDQRLKFFLNNSILQWLFIKLDIQKEKNHIAMIKFKVDKLLSEYKKLNQNSKKNVVMIIYLSRKLNEDEARKSMYDLNNPEKLESHFLSGWDQIMIDCLNGGKIETLKSILDLSTIDLVKKNLDAKLIAEMVFNIYLKFNFMTYNPNDMAQVKFYMTENIHKIESDPDLFEIIFKKCLEFLEDKDHGDWKIKICCDQKILSKSLNTFSAIKTVIEQIIEDPLLKIVHYLETESALSSYFYSLNPEKAKIFKQIWREQFEKKDINQMYAYNVTQSLNVNCIFNLSFPFSKGDICDLSFALKDYIEKIYIYDNAAYSEIMSGNSRLDQELVLNFTSAADTVNKIVRNSCLLFKIMSNVNERSLESAYISDLITYFLLAELKKEYKWKNSLEILLQKAIGYDVENLGFIFIFLWKNRKILDSLFNIFNSLCTNYTHAGATVCLFETNFIETILTDETLYDSNLKALYDLPLRKDAEIKTFLNIFNKFTRILLNNLNNIRSHVSAYGIIINVFISALLNFSLEVKEMPEALNMLIIVNEFIKILSNILKNNKEEIVKRVFGIFGATTEGIEHIKEDIAITTTTTEMIQSPMTEDAKELTSTRAEMINISFKDFKILKTILLTIDNEYEALKVRQKNPENEIKASFIKEIEDMIISGKITIFENIILGKCDYETRLMIIYNILKDDELCKHSSMIFYQIYMNPIQYPFEELNENLNALIKSEMRKILDDYFNSNKTDINSVIAAFFSDFFRKFFREINRKDEIVVYLEKNFENFIKALGYAKVDQFNSLYDNIVGYAGIKHYLDIYGRYLSDESIEKDKTLNSKINNILESSETFIEILRNFTLKSMASFFGGNANSLINLDYEKLDLHWVNNKLFENNDNALGIEPNLPEFEKINKEFNLFFVSLLNEDSEDNVEKLKNMILNSVTKPDIKFVLIQFFINKIWLSYTNVKYLSSYTYNHVLKIYSKISECVKTTYGEHVHNFLYNLVNNFPKNSYLKICPTTETNRIGMLTLSMQMFNMLVSFGSSLCIGKLFFDSKGEIVKTLGHWNSTFLPGGFVEFHDENLLVMMKHVDENYEIYGTQMGLYECMCGFLYTIGDCTRPYYVSQCPNCTSKIGGTGHVLMQGHTCLINADNRNEAGRKKFVLDRLAGKLRNNPGYVPKMADELSMHYCIRGLSSISFRFLNYFIHSMLYLLQEFGVVPEKQMESLIYSRDVKIKPGDYLMKHITTDIAKISELIKSKEFYIFMHVVFNEFIQLAKDAFKFDSAIEREKFEIAFHTKIIQPKLDKLAGQISDYKLFFNNDKKLTYLSIINENFVEEEIKPLSNFEFFRVFRYTRPGNWEDLKTEFQKKKINYQFIKLLIEKFDEVVNLSECLYPIVQFTNYMLIQCNYRYTRAEAKEKKIREVVEGNPTAEALFYDFCRAWSKISYKAKQWQCKSLPVLDNIDMDLCLSFILVDDRELGYGMYMAAAFQYLGMIQNEVLEAIVYLIKENNNYQIWGNMDVHKYSIQKLAPHEIIMHQTDQDYVHFLTDCFSKFYDVFNPHYGQGAIVEYNFEKIEGELAFKLLTNKKFIDYENLNKIQYKFELLSIQGKNSNLLQDIKNIIEQKPFSPEEAKEVTTALDRLESHSAAYLHQIFSSLEIILCNMRYNSYVENTTLGIFSQKIAGTEKISQILKDSQLISTIKLENILSFYELVEEKLFKYIIEFISPEYGNPLDEKVKIGIQEFLKMAEKDSSKYPSPKLISNVIQRFIIRCLVATLEPKFPIKEYLNRSDFWDIDTKEEIIDNFYFEFPDEIFISNTLPLLGTVNEYSKAKIEEGRLDLTEEKEKYDYARHEYFKKQNKFI